MKTLILLVLLISACSSGPDKPRKKVRESLSPIQLEVLGEMTKIEQAVIEGCLNKDDYGYTNEFASCIEDMRKTLGVCPTTVLEDRRGMSALGGAVLGYGAARLLHGGKKK